MIEKQRALIDAVEEDILYYRENKVDYENMEEKRKRASAKGCTV